MKKPSQLRSPICLQSVHIFLLHYMGEASSICGRIPADNDDDGGELLI